MNKIIKHTFVICAYKESKYLEACILSLKKQSMISEIVMATSTPNSYIDELAQKYEIPLFINEGEGGIVQDWNFAYSKAATPYITIAHQDDVYMKYYVQMAVSMLERAKKPLIFFSDYGELRNGETVTNNTLLVIKRMLLLPLRIKQFQKSKFVRRRILSFGNAIGCPTVTFAKDNLPKQVFTVGYRSDEDWEAWERISKLDGEFVYSKKICMCHRIHAESETSNILGDSARRQEDYSMFLKFWPSPIAKILTKFYSASEKSNQV